MCPTRNTRVYFLKGNNEVSGSARQYGVNFSGSTVGTHVDGLDFGPTDVPEDRSSRLNEIDAHLGRPPTALTLTSIPVSEIKLSNWM